MLTTLLSVAVLHWIILVTPGANVLVVSQLAAGGERRAACFAALGITAVAVIWASLAALGVHAIFVSHPQLRSGLQLAGGVYLCYVAVRLWRSAAGPEAARHTGISASAAFRLGFLTNIMNPKSALFFGSVFVTALPHDAHAGLMFAALALVLANALVWHLFLAMAFSHPRVQAAYARKRRALTRIASASVGFFGLRLVIAAFAELRTKLGGDASAIKQVVRRSRTRGGRCPPMVSRSTPTLVLMAPHTGEEKRHAAAGAALVGLGVALFALMLAYPERLNVPAPIGYITSAIVALGGLLALANVLGGRTIRRWLAVALLSCMVVPSAWIAVGPGKRICSATIGFLFGFPSQGECRLAFGIGALLGGALVLVALRYAFAGGRDEG